MSETRRWLLSRRRELLVRLSLGGALASAGVLLLALGVGVLLARAGLYRHLPGTVVAAWLAAASATAASALPLRRRLGELRPERLAAAMEREGRRRAGWVAGAASWEEVARAGSLARLADEQVATWLARDGLAALAEPRRSARRALQSGAGAFLVGAVAFAAMSPAAAGGRDFWRPVDVVLRSRGPVLVAADRTTVARGDTVRVTVRARGRRSADLLTRAPGEEWHRQTLALDTAGTASVTLGPLDSDRFVRAMSGGRESETVRVVVALPVLLTALELTARYPVYLERPDELLAADADTLWLPRGSVVLVRGRATVPVGSAAWLSGADTVALKTDGVEFSGGLPVRTDARWGLSIVSVDGTPAVPPLPDVTVIAVADSVPRVQVPVPGADTVAAVSLQQGLLIDARDDYRVRQLEVRSWRVSRRGEREEPVVDSIALPEGGAARVLLPWLLDLNGRGFVPGDTAFYQVAAADNAPVPHVGLSEVYSLRLPAMSELREAIREATRDAATGADSLASAQQELARRVEELAAERGRAETGAGRTPEGEQLPFDAVERTREVLDEQERLAQRADSLREEIRRLSDDAWAAGLTDPAFHRQLREIQDLLDRAMTQELKDALQSLRQALDRLSARDVEDALRRLAEASDRLRDDLARSRELFQRAAVEGELTTLSGDADELAAGQREWNARAERADSTAAAEEERGLAETAERLAEDLDRLAGAVDSIGMPAEGVREGAESSRAAAAAMRQARSLAAQGQRAPARAAGEQASGELDPLGASLRQERDEMRESWRADVLAQLDRALVETAGLAERQSEIAERVRRGETGPDVRGEQAAVREGVDRVGQRLQAAAGRNALVPRELGAALGLATLRMEESIASLAQASPSPVDAADLAGEALDALNAVVYAMLRSRSDVSSAQSGSGLSEALERMAQLAQQQGAMNGEAGSLFPLMQAGGEEMMQRLQALAAEQRALAQELERMRADGQIGAAGELAEQAEEVAQDLAGGRLDRETLDRQEQLYRRLLDAGRSLKSDEEDRRKERVAETARPGNVRLPGADAVPTGEARYPYPAWEELRTLSPEERRLILEYFRRLNRAPR